MATEVCFDCAGCGVPPPGGGRHPRCPLCDERNLQSTYFCCQECPALPWPKHKAWHVTQDAWRDDCNTGRLNQQANRETAEQDARRAERSGSEYDRLLAEATRYVGDQNWHRADKTLRKAIALEPGKPVAYYNLAATLGSAARHVEAAPNFLHAAARFPEGSMDWADSISSAFDKLQGPLCAEVAKPEWWNDEALKALSEVAARVTDSLQGHLMRAAVLAGQHLAWESGPRSAADLKEAAKHYERAARLVPGPVQKTEFKRRAAALRSDAAAMETAEAKAKAVVIAEAEVKANAAADALLAEEAAEEATAAASAGKAPSKGKGKAKGKGIKSNTKRRA